jgi:hypothetical protein
LTCLMEADSTCVIQHPPPPPPPPLLAAVAELAAAAELDAAAAAIAAFVFDECAPCILIQSFTWFMNELKHELYAYADGVWKSTLGPIPFQDQINSCPYFRLALLVMKRVPLWKLYTNKMPRMTSTACDCGCIGFG